MSLNKLGRYPIRAAPAVRLDGTEHAGHAVAKQDEKGQVTVTVWLAAPNS
ncbi:hypothetical protein [Mycobacterium sp. M23085]